MGNIVTMASYEFSIILHHYKTIIYTYIIKHNGLNP